MDVFDSNVLNNGTAINHNEKNAKITTEKTMPYIPLIYVHLPFSMLLYYRDF